MTTLLSIVQEQGVADIITSFIGEEQFKQCTECEMNILENDIFMEDPDTRNCIFCFCKDCVASTELELDITYDDNDNVIMIGKCDDYTFKLINGEFWANLDVDRYEECESKNCTCGGIEFYTEDGDGYMCTWCGDVNCGKSLNYMINYDCMSKYCSECFAKTFSYHHNDERYINNDTNEIHESDDVIVGGSMNGSKIIFRVVTIPGSDIEEEEEDSDVEEESDDEEEEEEEEEETIDYSKMKVTELKSQCKTLGLKRYSTLRKQDLINLLTAHKNGGD